MNPERFEECPHCGGRAATSKHPKLRYRCELCGGPQAPVADASVKKSGREVAALRRAQKARRSRALLLAGAIVGGLSGLAALAVLLVVAVVFGWALVAVLFTLLVLAPITALTFWMAVRARNRTAELQREIDAAWRCVAADVVGQKAEPQTAGQLAGALGLAETEAEELLAMLNVEDLVRGDVTEQGDVAYSVRMRVPDAPNIAEEQLEAEAEAEATDVQTARGTLVAGKR